MFVLSSAPPSWPQPSPPSTPRAPPAPACPVAAAPPVVVICNQDMIRSVETLEAGLSERIRKIPKDIWGRNCTSPLFPNFTNSSKKAASPLWAKQNGKYVVKDDQRKI